MTFIGQSHLLADSVIGRVSYWHLHITHALLFTCIVIYCLLRFRPERRHVIGQIQSGYHVIGQVDVFLQKDFTWYCWYVSETTI